MFKKKKGRHARQAGEEVSSRIDEAIKADRNHESDSAAPSNKDDVADLGGESRQADDAAYPTDSAEAEGGIFAGDGVCVDEAATANPADEVVATESVCAAVVDGEAEAQCAASTVGESDQASEYHVPAAPASPPSVQETIGSIAEIRVPPADSYNAPPAGSYCGAVNAMDAVPATSAFSIDAPKEKRNVGKTAGIVCGIIIALLLVAYIAGAVFFMGHMFPHTEVGDSDISLMSTKDVEAHLDAKTANYELDVSGYGYSLKLPGKNIGFVFDSAAVAQSMHDKQNVFAWPIEMFKDHDYTETVVATYDEAAVKTVVNETVEAHNSSATDSKDAHVGYDASVNRVVVVPEEYGTKLDANATNAAVKTAICSATRNLELKEDQLKQPAVKKDNAKLIKAAEGCNSLTTANMTFTVNGREAFKAGLSCIDQWIDIAEDGSVTLNNDKVNAWIAQTIANYTTAGNTRTYTRADGKQITVTGGVYGWEVDGDAFTEAVLAGLKTNSTETMEMPFSATANEFNGVGQRDWGNRYIDVDLSEQHAYMYDDSGALVWDSDVVTGNVNVSGRETPEGVYTINTMGKNVTLYTYEAGKEEPEKTLVYYWMPFVGNSIGLHDAWWQPGFGGTMYRDGYGSHGCVNLPSSAAADLYSIAQVGDVVVTHW